MGSGISIRINVIDSDVRRRARVSRELSTRSAHAEIFEDVEEFVGSGMVNGIVFIADGQEQSLSENIGGIRARMQAVLPIVGYAEEPAPEQIVAAMRAGALDYLKWPFDIHLVDAVVRRIARGDDRVLQQELLRSRAKAKLQNLSKRETDVLTLLLRGRANKEIGLELGISPRTVEIHRSNMMGKLGAQSSPEAVRIGVYGGLDVAHSFDLLAAA